MTAVLVGENLHKRFGPTAALRGADLVLERGETVAVMGPSGSGKSTLLHCLAGILAPDEGRVVFDGKEISSLSDDDRSAVRRSRFGFVFQFGQLIDELSAIENVMLPLLLGRVDRRTARQRSHEWLDRLGVANVAETGPSQMSGGQAQRVAVARAMVVEPEVIFADEPTGSLDSLAGEVVMNALVDAVTSAGAALVLVTHDPRVAAFAEREVIVRDGRTSTSVGR